MKDFTRLYEILKYQAAKFPRKDAISYKYNGQWRHYSSKECCDIIDKASRAFLAAGIKPTDKVAIISNNRPEWNFVDNGMMQMGAINVPIYPTISESDYKYIFNQAEIKMVFVSDQNLADKINNIKAEVPSLGAIYSFEENVNGAEHWSEFLKKHEEVDFSEVEKISETIKPTDLATMIYTSGTTGNPKGVMLSHDNIISNIKAVLAILPVSYEHDVLSFLPLCHIFERTVTYTYFTAGVAVYYAESIDALGETLLDVKPHFFSAVPRVLEKVFEKIMNKGMELKGLKRRLFFWSLDIAMAYQENQKPDWKFKIADKLVFSKWREAVGGRVLGIVTGAAALQERLARVFSAAGMHIREGYGQTETSPVISVNRYEPGGFKFGTVGPVIPGVEVKIDEQNGEILIKGPNVMLGYYKNEEATNKTIDADGWLHTGDVGKFDGKYLKITDRIKALFKTSGGKYVAPQVIEEKMKESPFIEQIMVVGEGEKFVSALIIPSFTALADWGTRHAVSADSNEELINAPEVQALLKKQIDKLNDHFGKIEKIKKFRLLADEWSIETGELTPTMKIKRKVVKEKYTDVIKQMYDV